MGSGNDKIEPRKFDRSFNAHSNKTLASILGRIDNLLAVQENNNVVNAAAVDLTISSRIRTTQITLPEFDKLLR